VRVVLEVEGAGVLPEMVMRLASEIAYGGCDLVWTGGNAVPGPGSACSVVRPGESWTFRMLCARATPCRPYPGRDGRSFRIKHIASAVTTSGE